MKHSMLPVLFAIATGCATDDPTTDTTDQAATACSLPAPGKAMLSRLSSDGRIITRTLLSGQARYDLDLVLAHGSVYGDGDWSCDYSNHGAGPTFICTNGRITCGFHYWADGPEVGCDDPDHPTC